ncbi:HNH endonuclease signature motif containing protein [Amycolatopsis anabasis]|uniref:HNH endonuclease n=1 Tax=Amycolatopsis anabasis TaxID=1840409 RepID=UPI00131D65FE
MPWNTSQRKLELPQDWKHRRRFVLERDRYQCQVQGPQCTVQATEVDHIQRGSNHRVQNLRAVCATCHSQKSSTEGLARQAQLRARRARPAERHPGRRVVEGRAGQSCTGDARAGRAAARAVQGVGHCWARDRVQAHSLAGFTHSATAGTVADA